MTANPFVRFAQDPVTTSALAAYALILFAALLATWYLLGRNLLTLYVQYNSTTWKVPTGTWAARAIAVPVILAIDSLLVGTLFWIIL